MLRRDRQIRMQVHQVVDAFLFAAAFLIAYLLRSNSKIIEWLDLNATSPLESFLWLYIVLIPTAPLVLESQGFYDRPVAGSRVTLLWSLFRGCLITTVGLIVVVYFFNLTLARPVMIWFGFISFGLVYLKEEIFQWITRSQLAKAQYR